MTDTETTAQARMEAALRPFGWTCGPEFWERYYTDPWVFSLANAVERLAEERDALRSVVRVGQGADFLEPDTWPDDVADAIRNALEDQ
jgi:hypothetical protein